MGERESDTRTVEEKIECILSAFDFEKVRVAMEALDWQWVSVGVPTTQEMRKTARGLLNRIANEEDEDIVSWHSGGFWASRRAGWLRLKFVVEHKDSTWCQSTSG